MNGVAAPSVAYRTRRKIALRLLPFIFLLYIINFVDRTNVGVAKLRMVDEPWFNDEVFGFGAGVFFIGYLALEIPGALIVERWSARKWIARILISWGLCTVVVGLVRSPIEFYGARFLLGLAEAGFFPGILVYITHWISLADRGRAISVLMLGVPCAMGLGSALSGAILQLDWFGVPGWRWVFILEGLPAVILGFVTIFYLTDHPRDARWLEPEERDWIESELKADKRRKSATAHLTIWQAFRERNVLLLTAILFLAALPNYVFMFWLPTILKAQVADLPDYLAALLSGLPYVAAIFGALAAGHSADRTGERRWHAVIPIVVFAVLFTVSFLPGQPLWLVMLELTLAGAAMFAYSTSYWVLPTLTLTASAAAASIGMINSFGNLSGFVGQSVVGYLHEKGYPFIQIAPFLTLCSLTAAVLICMLRLPPRNKPGMAKSDVD